MGSGISAGAGKLVESTAPCQTGCAKSTAPQRFPQKMRNGGHCPPVGGGIREIRGLQPEVRHFVTGDHPGKQIAPAAIPCLDFIVRCTCKFIMSSSVYVVTPSFNAATTIERTISSVVSQAGDFELNYRVQDGGSTDGTLAILDRWKRLLEGGAYPIQCRRINFGFESRSDNGMYDAIVHGFDEFTISRHAFMTWINADDLLMPGALALVHGVASSFKEEQVSWFGGTACVIKNDMTIIQVERPTPTCAIREGMCDGRHWHFVQQEGIFFRNWLWMAVDPVASVGKLKLAGDWNLWRQFAHHEEFVQVQWPLGAFRLREGQLSQVNGAAYLAEIDKIVSPSSRMAALQAMGDTGGSRRRLLKVRYPSGQLYVVEKSADGQTDFYYQKLFGNWPSRPLDDKGGKTEDVLFEAGLYPDAAPMT